MGRLFQNHNDTPAVFLSLCEVKRSAVGFLRHMADLFVILL